MAALAVTLDSIPNSEALIAPLTRLEAVYSNRIEGTQTTLTEVLTFEAEGNSDFSPEKIIKFHEVIQYQEALKSTTQAMTGTGSMVVLIRHAHFILMGGLNGLHRRANEFRRTFVWFGSPDLTIEDARYIPCPPYHVPMAIDNWHAFINSNHEIDPLVQLAIAHAELEAIHPYLDGNGRLSRLMVPIYMVAKDLLRTPHLYISRFLHQNRDEYYERLLAVTRDEDWSGWVEFFLKAVTEQAQSNMHIARKIRALYDDLKNEVVVQTHSHYGNRALDWIFEKPIFRSTDFVQNSRIPKPTAYRILKVLQKSQTLEALRPSRGRIPALLAFGRLLEIVEGTE